MQILVIDGAARTIRSEELRDRLDGVKRLIGRDSIDFDPLGGAGDRLYFDESCFIRPMPGAGRFQVDALAPLSGVAVVVGSGPGPDELATPKVSAEELLARVRFL
jgi:hypothetical protein